MVLTALGRTALGLILEAAALAIIILLLPAIGHQQSWLTIPVLCVGIPRAWWTLRKELRQVAHECAQGYIKGLREAQAEFREELRREIAARYIPVSPELDEALRGARHPQDLPESDLTAIQPAVAVVVRRATPVGVAKTPIK